MNARLIIALLVTVIMIIVYQHFFTQKPQQQPPPRQEQVVEEQKEEVEPEEPSPPIVTEQRQPQARVVYQEIVVDTPLYTATFSTYGGRLTSWKLKNYMDKVSMHPLGKFVQNMIGTVLGRKKVGEDPPQPVDLVNSLVGNDLFQNAGRRVPVDPVHDQKPSIEPCNQQVPKIGIERLEIGALVDERQ